MQPEFVRRPHSKVGTGHFKHFETTHQGHIKIRHKTFFGRKCKRHYVIVSQGCLYIFKSKDAKKAQQAYSFLEFEGIHMTNDAKNGLCLTFKNNMKRPLILSCSSSKERKEWFEKTEKLVSELNRYFSEPFASKYASQTTSLVGEHEPDDKSQRSIQKININDSDANSSLPMKSFDIVSVDDDNDSTREFLIEIDQIIWKNCSENKQKFEIEANKLLSKGILPDKKILYAICKTHGRKSAVVQNICDGICQNIKEQSNNIINVWPAFEYVKDSSYDENSIIFVVITKKATKINCGYEVYQRNVDKISSVNEGENHIIDQQEQLSDVLNDDIKSYLKLNATKLMDLHRNLTWVTSSGVKSSGYGRKSGHVIKKVPCIALYVQIKGLIPIDEEPFEEVFNGISVDVREGVFTLCGSSTDFHQHVRIGCAVDSGHGTNQGTVGPFFKYESDPDIYLITSAHVLLDANQMKKLMTDNQVNYEEFGTDIYQPPESLSVGNEYERYHLGKTDLAVYRKGGSGRSGLEIALVRINESRSPKTGKLPDESLNNLNAFGINEFMFPITKICDLTTLPNPIEVYKYGAVTGLSKGQVRFCDGSVRKSALTDDKNGYEMVLHEQIEITSTEGVQFGCPGDSGSLVFVHDGNRLSAVGIFEGKVNDTYMVTPISEIITALQESMSRTRDPPNEQAMEIDESHQVAISLSYVSDLKHTSPSVTAVSNKYRTDIQTNILQYTERKIDSVKSELSLMKKCMDDSTFEIKQIKQNMTQMEQRLSGTVEKINIQINNIGQKISDSLARGNTFNTHF